MVKLVGAASLLAQVPCMPSVVLGTAGDGLLAKIH